MHLIPLKQCLSGNCNAEIWFVQKSYCYTPGVGVRMQNVRANVSHEISVSLYFFLHFNFAYHINKALYNKSSRQARIRWLWHLRFSVCTTICLWQPCWCEFDTTVSNLHWHCSFWDQDTLLKFVAIYLLASLSQFGIHAQLTKSLQTTKICCIYHNVFLKFNVAWPSVFNKYNCFKYSLSESNKIQTSLHRETVVTWILWLKSWPPSPKSWVGS